MHGEAERQIGPVERAIRDSFSPPTTLYTLGQKRPFALEEMDERGIVLLLGRRGAHTRVTWECLESIPVFLRAHGGWMPVGGGRLVAGEPGTLDEHLRDT